MFVKLECRGGMKKRCRAWQDVFFCFVITLAVMPVSSRAAAKTWNTDAGNWSAGANWSPAGVPVDGDSVAINNAAANVVFEQSSAALVSFDMSAGRLVFSNWNTCLRAGTVSISGGTVTVANAFTDAAMSNRVWIAAAGNFTLMKPGTINVSNLGYAFASGPGVIWPTSGSTYSAGGGHGGQGGHANALGGITNDNLVEPMIPGAAGSNRDYGTNGGGAVLLDVGDTAFIGGVIDASGGDGAGYYRGGGAGGAILIRCSLFNGNSNGLLQANGGKAGGDRLDGAGGGGRISVLGALATPVSVTFAAQAGKESRDWNADFDCRTASGYLPGWGTLYFSDTNLFASMPMNGLLSNVVLYVADRAEWSVPSLAISNSSFRFGATNFMLNVAGDLVVGPTGFLGVAGSVTCGGSLVLTNYGILALYSGPTNALNPDYGALCDVAGDVRIGGNGAWIQPFSDHLNGGAPLLRMSNLFVNSLGTNGGINACGRGFAMCHGPGRGMGDVHPEYSGGGGYGGKGTTSSSSRQGGQPYGSSNMPVHSGSGGGCTNGGGYGGGVIRVQAENEVFLNGAFVANGAPGCQPYLWYGGGGSGGSILISCNKFHGTANAMITANGGNPGLREQSGGGGGGRIAVWIGSSIVDMFRQGKALRRILVSKEYPDYKGVVTVYPAGNDGAYSYPNPRGAIWGTSAFITADPCMYISVY